MPNKKLLFVVNQAAFFISNRLQLALVAQANGYDVHVACPRAEECAKLVEQYHFFYHPIPLSRKGKKLFSELKSLAALIKLYKRLQPDLIHHLTIKPVIYGGLAARLTNMPAVIFAMTGLGYVIIQTGIKASILRTFVKLLYRLSLNNPRAITIFQNEDDERLFIDWKLLEKKQSVVIKSSGVDVNHFTCSSEPEDSVPLIVLPARMLRDKGIYEFVTAAKIVKENRINARFVLVGAIDNDNPASITDKELRQWVRDGFIEWWGFQKNMLEIYKKAHIVCLPSYREGVPKALLEAAACGKSIVTTNAPGCREVVLDGWNGLLVPVKNSCGLAEALTKLIINANLRKEFAIRGREIAVRDFSIEHINQKTLATYQRLLDKAVTDNN